REQTRAGCWADAWGLGWDIRTRGDGAPLVGHGGQTNGFVARLTVVPSASFAVAILTNASLGFGLYPPVERRALELFRGFAPADRERVALAPEQLARLAGEYRNPDLLARVIAGEGGLRLERRARQLHPREFADLPPLELAP